MLQIPTIEVISNDSETFLRRVWYFFSLTFSRMMENWMFRSSALLYDDVERFEEENCVSHFLNFLYARLKKQLRALFSCQFNINRGRVNNTSSRDGVSLFCVNVRALR